MNKNILFFCISLLSMHFSITPFMYEGKAYPKVFLQTVIGSQSGSMVEFIGEKWTVHEERKQSGAPIEPKNQAEIALQQKTTVPEERKQSSESTAPRNEAESASQSLQPKTIILKPTSAAHKKGLKITYTPATKEYKTEEFDLPSPAFSNWMKVILFTTGVAALARYIYINTYGQ